MQSLEDMVNKAFNNKEKQDKFWANIEEVVTERLSRKPRRKRPPIDDDVLQSYCEMTDPEIALNDLTEETRNRIDNLDELLEGPVKIGVKNYEEVNE